MEEGIITMSVGNSSDIPNTNTSLCSLEDQGKTDAPTTASLITDNNGIVLLEMPRGNMFLSVANDIGGVNYTGISASSDLQGRQLLTTTLPASLLTSVQTEGIVDQQGVGVLLGVQTDGEETLDGSVIVTQTSERLLSSQTSPDQPKEQKRRGGWPKGKRRKAVPEITAPRAPATGYLLYAMERRKEIKETNPEIPFAEVTKILGQEWSSMDSEKKQKYLAAAETDKKRYIEELKTFQQSDAYQSILRKKKLKTAFSGVTGVGADGGENFSSLMEQEDEGMNELYCRVCDQYFSSLHNKKEHMYGRQHLQAITGELQKEIQLNADQQSQDSVPSTLMTSELSTDNNLTIEEGDTEETVHRNSSPVHVEAFIHGFLQENLERDLEIQILRRQFKLAQEENLNIYKQVNELKTYLGKLEDDINNHKALTTTLTSQLDALKMVSTLFGVINFQV